MTNCLLLATEGYSPNADWHTIISLITNYINTKARLPADLKKFLLDTIDSFLTAKSQGNLAARIFCTQPVNPDYSNGHTNEENSGEEIEERTHVEQSRIANNKGKNRQNYFHTSDYGQEKDRLNLGYQEASRVPPNISAKNESHFFEAIKEQLPAIQYESLMKLIYIYMKCRAGVTQASSPTRSC